MRSECLVAPALLGFADVPMSRAIPLAFVMTSFDPGGTERQMIELLRRIDPARWSVHLACTRTDGAWFARAAEAARSVGVFRFRGFARPSAWSQTAALARWYRANEIAVVHTTELYSNIFGLAGAALAGVPVRIGNRRELNPDKGCAHIALQRAAYGLAHKVVANSRATAERLRLERVPPHKIAVVANGLDAGAFEAGMRRRRLRRVVVVANLRPEKGHDVLIDAAVIVLRQIPDAQFEIVGAGPALESLMARASARGVTHACAFLGHRDDVPARLADADIFALPSRSDAFPNAALEAMAAGLPIVASRVGGIPELIDHERTGLLVPPGDAASLADRLCRLMIDPELGARLGDAARDEVQSRYSFDRMVAAFESIYLVELARSARSRHRSHAIEASSGEPRRSAGSAEAARAVDVLGHQS
jgi:glycosyltransferase involved in cell wall biosynthesis